MKKSVLIAAICFALIGAGTVMAQDQAQVKKPPAVARRQVNQQRRIRQGEKSGQLTRPEARKLERQQRHIQRTKARDKAVNGGKLTRAQKAHINKMQNRASRNIYRKKHNARTQH